MSRRTPRWTYPWQAANIARAEVARMDPKLTAGDHAYLAAVVLLTSAMVGNDELVLADAVGVSSRLVRVWGRRWREAEVWGPKHYVAHREWAPKGTGGIAFWLHVNVALGYVMRAKSKEASR